MSRQVRFIVRSLNASFTKYGLDTQGGSTHFLHLNAQILIIEERYGMRIRTVEPQVMFQGMAPLDPGFGEEPESSWGEFAYQTSDGKTVSEKSVPSPLPSPLSTSTYPSNSFS